MLDLEDFLLTSSMSELVATSPRTKVFTMLPMDITKSNHESGKESKSVIQ
jgi:hypothetical protein